MTIYGIEQRRACATPPHPAPHLCVAALINAGFDNKLVRLAKYEMKPSYTHHIIGTTIIPTVLVS